MRSLWYMNEPSPPHEMESPTRHQPNDLPFAHRNAYGRTGRALVATLSLKMVTWA